MRGWRDCVAEAARPAKPLWRRQCRQHSLYNWHYYSSPAAAALHMRARVKICFRIQQNLRNSDMSGCFGLRMAHAQAGGGLQDAEDPVVQLDKIFFDYFAKRYKPSLAASELKRGYIDLSGLCIEHQETKYVDGIEARKRTFPSSKIAF
uniref:Uncharacterized protein n=1 Tax=Macrostomum lignano TaxID=282301 RepID=A0A1I8GJU4_9PLAT